MKLLDYDINIRNTNTECIAYQDGTVKSRAIVEHDKVKGILTKICDTRDIDSDKMLRLCKAFKVKSIKVRTN